MKAALLLLIAAALPSAAYKREDHATTARLSVRDLAALKGVEIVVASCAQLPDEAGEFSAIDVYRRLMRHPLDYAGWAAGRAGPPETAGRMVLVQHLLHGLTGGTSAGVRAVAREVLEKTKEAAVEARRLDPQARADAACALGFAIHLYGDSFAHSRLRNHARMYDTGVGHLFDSSRPDLPLLSKARLALWREYVEGASALLSPSGKSLESVLAASERHAATARERNGFNEGPLQTLLADAAADAGGAARLLPYDRSKKRLGCQRLLAAHLEASGVRPAPSCDQAWRIFREQAVESFDAYDSGHRDAPSRAPLSTRYYDGSPLDRGLQW